MLIIVALMLTLHSLASMTHSQNGHNYENKLQVEKYHRFPLSLGFQNFPPAHEVI